LQDWLIVSSSWPMRCDECGKASNDDRWAPLCPPCYERLGHELRRAEITPQLEPIAWRGPTALEERFEAALGAELP
jgi:hypothetical protein